MAAWNRTCCENVAHARHSRNLKRAVAGIGVGGGIVIIAAVWAFFALVAPAQNPEPPTWPGIPSTPVNPETSDIPKLRFDEDVQPAQLTMPGGVAPGAATVRTVPDPPTPVVRIQVRVPADSPLDEDIKYVITVTNTSNADAHGVKVRNPLSDHIQQVVKADPQYDAKLTSPKELVWTFGTLAPGKSKTIELTLKPKKDASEIKNLAYVSFEHGEAVTTQLKQPIVKIAKSVPKQTVRDEPFVARIVMDNTGRVPVENIRVAENVPASADFEPITKGAKRTVQPEGQQWVWEIAKLMPGERKVLEYRVTAREAKDVFALTNLSANKGIQDKAESRTTVLVPGLTVKLTGPAASAPVGPGEPARYELTVRNAGTLPSTGIRVSGTIPADCKPTKKTEGGQLTRDAVQWTIPRLEAGEAQTFRFEVKSHSTGRRVVVATVSDARGQRAADETATLFQGTAALVWESVPNPVALAVGRQGTFTVKVRNNGGEPARNVRVEIEMPDAVSLVQVTPTVRPLGSKLAFGPEVIAANGEATYTLTFEARQSAQAWFKIKMTADSLGDKPMQTQKAVEITGGNR